MMAVGSVSSGGGGASTSNASSGNKSNAGNGGPSVSGNAESTAGGNVEQSSGGAPTATVAGQPADKAELTSEAAGPETQGKSLPGHADTVAAAWGSDEEAPGENAAPTEEPAAAGQEMSPEDKARVAEYDQMAQRHQDLISQIEADMAAGVYMAGTPDDPNMQEFSELTHAISGIRGDFDQAMGAVQAELGDVQKQAEYQLTAENSAGAFMTEPERASFSEFADQRMAEVSGPLNEATEGLLQTIDDPVFQANFQDWTPDRQHEFFQDMASTMTMTPTGQEWVSDFNQGLAELGRNGASQNVFAEVAQELRSTSTPEQLESLDGALGLLVGTDQAINPEGAAERMAQVGEALGIPEEELATFPRQNDPSGSPNLPSAPGALYGAGRFTNAAALAYNTFQASGQDWSGNDAFANASTVADLSSGAASLMNLGDDFASLGRFSATASKFSAYLSLGSAAYQASQGNLEGAVGPALGAAGALVGVNPVGLTLMGASVLSGPLMEQADYSNFVWEGMNHVMGGDAMGSLRGMALATTTKESVNLMSQTLPAGMTLPEYFDQELNTFADTQVGVDFWNIESPRLIDRLP